MILTNTITKKALENIISESFSKFGNISSSSLLDSLKLLGFSYATFAGISINIEDLKTPDAKKEFLDEANREIDQVSFDWSQGNRSDTERFQTIIDSWNMATESLKNRIVEYYQNFDPLNNLYIMAFSGARGNMSQVRQLVGMRGLMSDQDGKIIDLPIQSNFREGLSSIDYIISSYGARKGIVDTALKTADSGYLTRRLIYLAQDLIIRQKDCYTKNGIIIFLDKPTNIKNLIGRYLIFSQKKDSNEKKKKNIFLTSHFLENLKNEGPITLNIRSSLTCETMHSICQNCYGWDLGQRKPISLGEAVGIVAAQSIGEPGTQLTMRTFHTGGIFTGELVSQIVAPYSGKLYFPPSLKMIAYRNSHGILVSKLQQEVTILLVDWLGKTKEIFLEIGSFLYINPFSFIKKGDLIGEFFNHSVLPGKRSLKPIFTQFSGEIKFANLNLRKITREKGTLKVNQDEGVLWISSGKLYLFPKEIKLYSRKFLEKNKPLASLNLITPQSGIIKFFSNQIILEGRKTRFFLNLSHLKLEIKNIFSKVSILLKNYQRIDNYSVFGHLNFFPKDEGKIYIIRKKNSKYKTTFFIVTEEDTWKIFSENETQFSLPPLKKLRVKPGSFLNSTLKTRNAGFFFKKDGFNLIFQKAYPIFLSRGSILNYKHGDFVAEKKIVGHLVNYSQQTEDIVQGLPKVEELIEARKPKAKAHLVNRPGILLNSNFFEDKSLDLIDRVFEKNIIKCINNKGKDKFNKKSSQKQDEKQTFFFLHSLFIKEEIIIFEKKIYKKIILPPLFTPFKTWTKVKKSFKNLWLYSYKNNKIFTSPKILQTIEIYQNSKKDLIFCNKEKPSFFLEYLNPITEYQLPLSSKILFESGNFVDIGEPFTEGIIDIHELLNLLIKYHITFDGTLKGSFKGLHKFQLLLINSIQAIYQSQGVNISSKHIEVIVRQMTGKARIKESGDSPLLAGELISLSLMSQIYQSLMLAETKLPFKLPIFEPILLSSTNSSLTKDGFLSSAGFQETKRILSKAAIEGSTDWLRGLKECIIVGRLIPAGSTFLNYKNYLDNVYLFKNN